MTLQELLDLGNQYKNEILSIVLTLYSVFVLKNNFLELNILVYLAPLLSLFLTLYLVNRVIKLNDIPGFGKISSLLILIFLTFVIVFLLQKMFIGIVFVGSLKYIIITFVIIFLGIKYFFDKFKKS